MVKKTRDQIGDLLGKFYFFKDAFSTIVLFLKSQKILTLYLIGVHGLEPRQDLLDGNLGLRGLLEDRLHAAYGSAARIAHPARLVAPWYEHGRGCQGVVRSLKSSKIGCGNGSSNS